MASQFDPGKPYFQIWLLGGEEVFPPLLDVSSFLYDFNLLYEIARLATDYNYGGFRFSNFVYYRKGRPLEDGDRLRLQSLNLESPLVVVTALGAVAGAVGSLWGIVQIVETVLNLPLNRRKLKAEVEKLERENREAAQGRGSQWAIRGPEQVRRVLQIREAETYYDNVAGRLERSAVRIKEVEIQVVQANEEPTPTPNVTPTVTPPPSQESSSS